MFIQLLVGAGTITMTVIIQVVVMRSLAWYFHREQHLFIGKHVHFTTTVAMIGAVLLLVVGVTISCFIWAGVFMLVSEFDTLEPAVYFAVSSFTTLGFGDLLLSEQWRILGALTAVNGMIVFGLNTAFLLELIIRAWGKRAGM